MLSTVCNSYLIIDSHAEIFILRVLNLLTNSCSSKTRSLSKIVLFYNLGCPDSEIDLLRLVPRTTGGCGRVWMLNPPLGTAIEISQFQIGDKILRTPIKSTVPDIQCRVRCWWFGSVQPKPRSTRTRRLLIFSGIIHSCLRTFKLNQFERRLINSNDGWVQTVKYLKYIQHKIRGFGWQGYVEE